MTIRDLTLDEMRPAAVFERAVLHLIATMAGDDAPPMAGHKRLLLDLYSAELSYERLNDVIFGYLEGTAQNSLFARQGDAYTAFMAAQQAWLDRLFADRITNPNRKRSKYREENTTADFVNDFTATIQWDAVESGDVKYDNMFYREMTAHYGSAHFRTTVPAEILEILIPSVLNIIDIVVHERSLAADIQHPMPAAAVQWIEDLFAWFDMVYTWRETALRTIAAGN